jgi:hypothetical protein
MPKPRKDRSDIRIGKFEEKHGLPPGTIRNTKGKDIRSDAKLGTVKKKLKK